MSRLTVELGPVPDTLQQLLLPALGLHLLLVIPLQPGLDTPAITDSVSYHNYLHCIYRLHGPVLLVEVVHVWHQILDHVHVGQRVDLGRLVVSLDLGEAGQGVHTACVIDVIDVYPRYQLLTDIHGAGSADSLPAAPPEGEAGVHLVLDLDQGVQHLRMVTSQR